MVSLLRILFLAVLSISITFALGNDNDQYGTKISEILNSSDEYVDKIVLVEGKVYKIELTVEEAVEYFQHQGVERGEKFDPSTVTEVVTIYQIKGIGAEIDNK